MSGQAGTGASWESFRKVMGYLGVGLGTQGPRHNLRVPQGQRQSVSYSSKNSGRGPQSHVSPFLKDRDSTGLGLRKAEAQA